VSLARPIKRMGAALLLRSRALRLDASVFAKGRAILLLYHRVNDEADPFFPALPVRVFLEQLDYVAGRYAVEPLEDVVDWLAHGAKGPPRVAITIDDGYPDTVEVVLPELERRRLPATLFLATLPPETGKPLWVDRARWLVKHARVAALPAAGLGLDGLSLEGTPARLATLAGLLERLKALGPAQVERVTGVLEAGLDAQGPPPGVLRWEDVRRLDAGGVRLGAHTHRHFPLSRLDDAELESEVVTSVRLIEERTGAKVTTFAYPNGEPADYDARAIALLRRRGLRCALTTRHGLAWPGDDAFQLPRMYTTEPSTAMFAARLSGLFAPARAAETA
jgi:peptidoglycan/xylan/chitin deacetylase (PgdA/CDA1 family)